ncbi:hypothetical protein [Chengkuizengella marina]|uniref:Uncharacterized protein n=1 Tax=Chengkuizengella marina TaxID=2507566 RepID=A0A6N9Q7U7_9BACL|nr:hypothetical protein [Chengkuizengella marina]NBI30928.1 hypothetical protein [Chengkuizengella marina]
MRKEKDQLSEETIELINALVINVVELVVKLKTYISVKSLTSVQKGFQDVDFQDKRLNISKKQLSTQVFQINYYIECVKKEIYLI